MFHPAVGCTAGDLCTASLRDILGWNAFIAAHREDFQRTETVAHFEQARARGKIGILIGQQNSAHSRSVFDLDGIDYAKKIYDPTEGLVSPDYSSRNIELTLGGNFARALNETWTA